MSSAAMLISLFAFSAFFRGELTAWAGRAAVNGHESRRTQLGGQYASFPDDEGKTWGRIRNLEETPDDAWAYSAVT